MSLQEYLEANYSSTATKGYENLIRSFLGFTHCPEKATYQAFLILLVILGRVLYGQIHLQLFPEYTYGKIIELEMKRGAYVIYEYKVDHKLYEGTTRYGLKLSPKVGDTNKVVYSSKDPNISKMILK